MLIKYELLKILCKKSTLIIMAASLIITAFLFGLPIIQFQTYNQDGVIKGSDGIEYEKEQYKNLSTALTNEYVATTISEVQELFKNPDNVGYDGNEQVLIGDAYWNNIAPREDLLRMIASVFSEPNESVGYTKLLEIDVSSGIDFFQARLDKIEKLLNSPSRELSEAQKEFWLDIDGNVSEPLQFGYYEAWETIVSCFELLIFAIFAVCIAVAPVFSGEYQNGTDAVLLAAKYGKTKLTTAKISAALIFGLLSFTLHIVVAFGLPLIAFGFDGWDLPLQIAGATIPYPLTFLEGTLLSLGVIYLVLIAMVCLTLFLSSKVKNPYFVLAVLVPILFLPLFLSPNGTTGIYNMTLFILPYHATTPNFGKYISYQFGGLVLDAFTVRAIFYTLLSVIMLPLARLGFKKHQVSA